MLLRVNQWTLIGWETGRQTRVFARHEAAIVRFLGYSPFPPVLAQNSKKPGQHRVFGATVIPS